MYERMISAQQREYGIRLHVPQGDPPATGFPVIWLLDTPTTWAPMQQALHEHGEGGVVVIGIGWTDEGSVDPNLRRRDFTLPARHQVPPPRGSAEAWCEDGDSDAFLAFLTQVLQPRYLRTLPLDPERQTLVGHSLSGLFVLNVLLARPRQFQRYVAASPSVWWDGGRILDDAGRAVRTAAHAARALITVGSGEQVAGPEKPPAVAGEDAAAVLGEQHMVDNAAAFADLLRRHGATCEFRLFEGETHHSVLPPAMAAALAFARNDRGSE